LTRIGIAAGALRFMSMASFTVAMTACASVSLDEPFEGTPWRLVQLGGQIVYVAGGDPKAEPRVQFSAGDSLVTGSGGCNSLSASYRRNEHALRIGPIASTRRGCADRTRTDIEGRFVAALQATTSFDLKGAQLTLLDQRALPLAVLELGLREQP